MLRSSYSERIIMNYYERGEMNDVKNVMIVMSLFAMCLILVACEDPSPASTLSDGFRAVSNLR